MLGVVVLGQTALVEQVAMLELVAVVVLVQQVEVVALEMLAAEVSLVAEGHGRWESRVAAPKDACEEYGAPNKDSLVGRAGMV